MEKVPTLLAIVPAAAVLCSTFYWVGVGVVFKWSILTLLSVQDLIASAITWLPLTFLLWGFQWMYLINRDTIKCETELNLLTTNISSAEKIEEIKTIYTSYLMTKQNEYRRVNNIVTSIGLVTCSLAVLSILILPDALPIVLAFLALIGLAILVFNSPISTTISSHITPISILCGIVFLSFIWGAIFGVSTKFNHEFSAVITTKNGKESNALIIASLSKGFVFLDKSREIVFISTDQIAEIRETLPAANKGILCLVFDALC